MEMEQDTQDTGTEQVDALVHEGEPQPQPERVKHPGYDPVDLSGLPEEVRKPLEDRIDYLFKQIKNKTEKDRDRDRTLNEYKSVAQMQADKIEELMSATGKVVNHLHQQTMNETEASLKSQMRAAWEAGDNDKYFEIQEKLDEIRINKKIESMKPKTAPQPKQAPAPAHNIQMFEFTKDDDALTDAWQYERGSNGELLRPWAHNKGTDESPDPQYIAGVTETISVFRNPRFKNYTTEQKLAEVDRRMGVVRVEHKQNVMGANLTGQRKTNKVTLSPKAQEIALRTAPGKTDAERLEWYRKQVERTSHKGAR